METTLSYFNDSSVERLNESQSNESSATVTPKWDHSQALGPIRTGIPIFGKQYQFGEEGDNSQNTTTQRSAALEGPQKWHQLNRQNSNIWIILFIVGFILVIIFALLMVGGVAKVSNRNKSKGDIVYLKK